MNYKTYKFSAKELMNEIMVFCVLDAIMSFIFYDSMAAFFLILFFIPVYLKRRSKALCAKRMEKLSGQFCEMINGISTALSAGYSVTNAFVECKRNMDNTYGTESLISNEIQNIISRMEMNISTSESLREFAVRTGNEDINDFADVFSEAISSGGNLNEIIRNTVSIMEEKKKIEDEIKAMLNGKLLEQKVICFIPVLLFLYLRISNREFIGILYHNMAGIIVMTVCQVIYVSSILLSDRIVNIKV